MILGGLVMISIGLFIIIGTFKLFKPTDYSTWKDAESIVEKVRTETWDDGELRPCLPRIIVSFELDGELIKGKSNCIGTEKTIKQVIAKYPKGSKVCFKYDDEYYGAAEPPVRCGESHLSGLTEPLRSL